MMLLFAVRMVRTGIERSFGASFERWLTRSDRLPGAAVTGVAMALILQSSAAVALLAAGFAASGYLAFPAGLAIVLGGDLGSALVIQVLSFRLDWLVPVLLALGGWLFINSEHKLWRQMGRILLGIAFILIALRFLREAMDPIRDSAFLPAIAGYLARDYVTAFLVGAALAFVMHSSVAAILMCVTLAQIGAIPFAAALSLVLGANLGAAFIPIWLSRRMPPEARRIPLANLALRGSGAVLALFAINVPFDADVLKVAGAGQSLVYAHVGFNLVLVIVALPFCRMLERPMAALLPTVTAQNGIEEEPMITALDETVLGNPQLSVAALKRELLHMIQQIEIMLRQLPEIYETGEQTRISGLRRRDHRVNRMLSDIRGFTAAIPRENYSKADNKTVRGLMEYAIRLEAAGDVISKRMTDIAAEKRDAGARFSKEGWDELLHIHREILANIKLASNVLISDDLECARQLMMEKTEMKNAERKSRKRHLARLQEGREESFASSDVHLETLRALRDVNSHISAIAYPILYREGQLLDTRLIQNMDIDEMTD